jgi:hypothetical protein
MEIDREELSDILQYIRHGLTRIVDAIEAERPYAAVYDVGLMQQAVHYFYHAHVAQALPDDEEEDDDDE